MSPFTKYYLLIDGAKATPLQFVFYPRTCPFMQNPYDPHAERMHKRLAWLARNVYIYIYTSTQCP